MRKLNDITYNIAHPVPLTHTGLPHSVGLIHNDMKISKITEQQLPLLHAMLHMFYVKKTGKGLSKKTIEKLHKEVSKRLKHHKIYDKLDYI